jgi:hypothetical protein
MIKFFKQRVVNGGVNNQCVVAVDADSDAERVVIIDRNTTEVFHNFNYQSNKQLKFIVPLIYSVNANLLVGILDDNRFYNAKFVDGVKAELINGNTVNIRP